MKKSLVFLLVALLAGCSSPIQKQFNVLTDPQDSEIKLISSHGKQEQLYRSPAAITVEVPEDRRLAARMFLDVRKESYHPKTIPLTSISDGDTLMVKLQKIHVQSGNQLFYRLLRPIASAELQFQDKIVAISFAVQEQWFQIDLKNTSSSPITIHWEQSEYTDVYTRGHRLMHSGIHYQNRNNPIPSQLVQPGKSIHQTIIPISNVFLQDTSKGYQIKPLFKIEKDMGAGLKGKTFNIFIPVEINRQIIPYNFTIEIQDVPQGGKKG